jgi:GT2 family glycosyltransferase
MIKSKHGKKTLERPKAVRVKIIHRKKLRSKIVQRKKVVMSAKKMNQIYDQRYNMGFDAAYQKAYAIGWDAGVSSIGRHFNGTSIVLVTTNDQQGMLQQCIDSIEKYTPEPHEIIVIDNASTDDTAEYLQKLTGKVRYKICHSNLGFAGGTNQGLMMARGNTILFLNNDTVVTEGWLQNLLHCLNSNPKIGLVGPVTNYISGEQLIETSYSSMDEMHQFARGYNISDPNKWKTTSRLTGFCVLMRREVLDRLGNLDEGFEIGNCEDDDYGLRARLLGLDLMIAKDTFIHHVGSVSIKALGDKFEEVYGKNLEFYANKWGDTHSLLSEVQRMQDGSQLQMNHFYPSHVLVKGAGPKLFWIENGVRHPLLDMETGEASRVSQIDLRNWEVGAPVTSQEIADKLAALSQGVTSWHGLSDGKLVASSDGTTYQYRQGRLHRLINERAITYWKLEHRHNALLTENMAAQCPQGLPIIAPSVIVATNI